MKRALLVTLLVLAGILPIIPLTPGAAALTTYTENFNDDQLASPPTSNFYTLTTTGTGSQGVVGTPSVSGNSYRVKQTADAAFINEFDLDGPVDLYDFCNNEHVSWAFRFAALPPAGDTVSMGMVDATAADSAILRIDNGGNILLIAQGSASATTYTITDFVVATNTWYNVTIHSTLCVPFKVVFDFPNQGQFYNLDSVGNAEAVDIWTVRQASAAAQTGELFIDNLVFVDAPDLPPTAVGSSATAAVTDLVGFDVDPEGKNLIVRTDDGEFVRTFNPYSDDGTLDELDFADTCDPSINDGVVASQFGSPDSVVGYLTCEAGTNDPDFFRIRNALLDPPSVSCQNDCDFDIDLETDIGDFPCTGEFADRSDLRNIKQVEEMPLDYSTVVRDPVGEGPHLAVGYAYTTTAGRLGVAKYVTQDGCNGYGTARTQFSTSEPEDFCFWRYNDRNFLAAVDAVSATQVYEYDAQLGGGAGTIGSGVTFSSLHGGLGISCAADKMIVLHGTGSRVSLIDIDNGTILWTKEVNNAPLRSVLIDPSAQFVFWIDDPSAGSPYQVTVGWASNGTAFGSFVTPSGAWRGMRTDGGAQNLWVAQAGSITWYEPARNLDEIPEGCSGVSCIPDLPDDGEETTGLFDPSDAVSEGVFRDVASANAWSAILLTIFTGVIMGGAPAGFQAKMGLKVTWSDLNTILMLVGVVLGFGLAWLAFHLISDAWAISLIVACLVLLSVRGYFAYKSSRGG